MRPLVLLISMFLLLTGGLWAFVEQEPNDLPADDGILWCENGSHTGTMAAGIDTDFWYFNGWPGDNVQISLTFAPGQTLWVGIIDHNLQTQYTGTNATGNISFSYSVTEEETYYVVIQHMEAQAVDYTLNISGLFISATADPLPPTNLSIANGATNVSVETTGMTWTWGDGSWGGNWNLFWGPDPNNLSAHFPMFSELVNDRAGSFDFPDPLAGYTTYYYQMQYANMFGVTCLSPVYQFTTGPRLLPTPILEHFDIGMGNFFSLTGYWLNYDFETGDPGTISTISMYNGGILMELGHHDLSSVAPMQLTFKQAGLFTEDLDRGYVEYSTDGGINWAVMPVSSYRGSGIYDLPLDNPSGGPCFDKASYPSWPTWSESPSLDELKQTEIFDLSPWLSCSSFRLRYRVVFYFATGGSAWVIDDFGIQPAPPLVPSNPYPANLATNFGTYEYINWSSAGATSYSFRLHSDPAFTGYATLTDPNYACDNLLPSTTYYWMVQAHNAIGSSEWSPQWHFTTGPYSTTRHNSNSLWISNVSFGAINNSSAWSSFCHYSGLSTNLESGSSYPIQVQLTGGMGPEAVGVWIDLDGNHVFGNNPAEFTALSWNGAGFGGTINLPTGLTAMTTRMRVQGIHTNNTDVLNPVGVFNYGETEDYNVTILAGPVLSISPDSGVFTETLMNRQSPPMRFTFSNAGTGSLDITLTGIGGTDADCFVLQEGNSYPIHLTTNLASVDISHQAQRSGPHSAYLLVRDNLTRTDHQIPLSGTTIGLNTLAAISFNAESEYAEIPSAAPLQSLSAFTIEIWLRWDSTGTIQFVTAKALEELEIHTTTNNSLRFIPTTGVYLDAPPNVLIPGRWHHIACVYDPSVPLGKVYVDGIDTEAENHGSHLLTQPVMNSGAALRFGSRAGGAYQLQGALDEARLWNRALSAEEIRNLMHLRQASGTPSLVANWRMNEENGSKLWDEVNHLHGSLINMEPEDRIDSEALIGSGIAVTQMLSTIGQNYDFGETGLSFIPDQLDAPGYVTVTRLDNLGGRVANPSWIMQVYDTSTRTGRLNLASMEDLWEYYLPERNFGLHERSAFLSAEWSQTLSADQVDLEQDLVSYPGFSVGVKQLRSLWQRLELLSPKNIAVTELDGELTITWDAVPGADTYRIYSSDDPLSGFEEDDSGYLEDCSWSTTAAAAKRFYHVIAECATW